MAIMRDVEMLEAIATYYGPQTPDLCGAQKECPVCGEPFPSRKNWGYGVGATDTCSWKCARLLEKGIRMEEKTMTQPLEPIAEPIPAEETAAEGQTGQVGRSVFDGQEERIIWRLNAGESLSSIARSFDRTPAALKIWADKHAPAVSAAAEAANAKRAQSGEAKKSAEPETRAAGSPAPAISRDELLDVWGAIGVIRGVCRAELIDTYWPIITEALNVIQSAVLRAAG